MKTKFSTLNYLVRPMHEHELSIAINWAKQEGWNPGLNDAECFYQADPYGFFVGLLNEEPIAVGCAVNYDENFAFCGLYIVKQGYRKQGYGMQLTMERLKHVADRITGIDGVVENVNKYQNIGYVPFFKNTRYVMNSLPLFNFSQHVQELKEMSFHQVDEFDRNYFPAKRSNFLRFWINQNSCHALGYWKDECLEGYGVIRKCYEGYKIGPLFAKSKDIAKCLFESLCSKIKYGPVYLDVPEPNKHAISLVNHYGMTPSFDVIRMYRNGCPSIDLDGIYGMTTFELG